MLRREAAKFHRNILNKPLPHGVNHPLAPPPPKKTEIDHHISNTCCENPKTCISYIFLLEIQIENIQLFTEPFN
jgi:hypothetical protein